MNDQRQPTNSVFAAHKKLLQLSDNNSNDDVDNNVLEIELARVKQITPKPLMAKTPQATTNFSRNMSIGMLAAVLAIMLVPIYQWNKKNNFVAKGAAYVGLVYKHGNQVDLWQPATVLHAGDLLQVTVIPENPVTAFVGQIETSDKGTLLHLIYEQDLQASNQKVIVGDAFEMTEPVESESILVAICPSNFQKQTFIKDFQSILAKLTSSTSPGTLDHYQMPNGCTLRVFSINVQSDVKR